MKLLDRELLMDEVRPWGEPYNIVLVGEVIDLIEDTMCEVDAEEVVYRNAMLTKIFIAHMENEGGSE